jgi:hypothetical protein
MPNDHQMMKIDRLPLTGKKTSKPLDLALPGMPASDSIQSETSFKPKGGGTYRILKTTEVDTYEDNAAANALRTAVHGIKAPSMAAVSAAMKLSPTKRKSKKKPGGKKPPAKPPKPAPGTGTGPDDFAGTARKIAKLSIATAAIENFTDVAALIATLPSVATMVKLKIPTTADSDRVAQEKRNIHVTAFLYAASREADNDFHLIIGRDPAAGQEMYMTMELSGLPASGSAAFPALNAARTAYKSFFGAAKLPGAGYNFYQPPIPVVIDGSLFFDATHSTGQAPGPPSLKSRMPTIWEVHPISNIKLG